MQQARATSRYSGLHRFLIAIAVTAVGTGLAAGYEDEVPIAPSDGESVYAMLDFYIQADGSPQQGEYYKIEVARDPDFENVVASYDSEETKRGWVFGDLMGLEDIPAELMPERYQGIHLRTRLDLPDGEYFWRAFKAVGGGEWELIGDELSFFVDTTPPATVAEVDLWITEQGELAFDWEPVVFDLEGNQELVGGYRIYRYTSTKKRYPTLTRYLIAETEATEHYSNDAVDDGNHIVFYRIQAVDETGNEEGRRRPAPIGTFEHALEPFDAERAVDPRYFSQQGR